MKIESVTIGLKVKHPQYGEGVVKSITEHAVDVQFEDARRTVDPEASGLAPSDASVSISGLNLPLPTFVETAIQAMLDRLGVERPDAVVDGLAPRWHGGRMVLHPADPTLQTKEVPLEVFFHKIVGVRNQLRVLEQKINAHATLSDAEKVDLQQYITRCYGSFTTFNLLFRVKEDQFNSKGEA